MFGASYQIAKVWGIPVKIHISLVILLIYVGLSGGIAAGRHGGWLVGGRALISNVTLMVLVFASVALHELGHSFVALRKGCRVRKITLMIIGGAAQLDRIPSRPRDELLMAAAGPLVSLLIGITSLTGGLWMVNRGVGLAGELLVTLGMINLVLAVFNLLPAFPMDGGRILRAGLSNRMGRLRATFIAARIGKWLAIVMGLIGLATRNWFLVAIAFFIYSAAGAEYRMLQLQDTLRVPGDFFEAFRGGRFPGQAAFRVPDAAAYDFDEENSNDVDDGVIVSPPPYRRGPAVRVSIHRENRST